VLSNLLICCIICLYCGRAVGPLALEPSPEGSLGHWERWCLGNGMSDIWLRFGGMARASFNHQHRHVLELLPDQTSRRALGGPSKASWILSLLQVIASSTPLPPQYYYLSTTCPSALSVTKTPRVGLYGLIW
jgi:hypothetical protein